MAGKHVGFSTSASLGFAWDPKLTRAFAEGYNANPDTNPHASGSPAHAAYEAGRSSSEGYETDGSAGFVFRGIRMTVNKFLVADTNGPADSDDLTLSYWVRFTGQTSTTQIANWGDGVTADSRCFTTFDTGNGNDVFVRAAGVGTGFTILGNLSRDNNSIQDGEWHHILCSIRTDGATTSRLYVDGEAAATAVFTDAPIGWSDVDRLTIGSGHNFYLTGKNYTIDIAEFWLDDSFVDLSVAANREKFISNGAAVSLGNGQVFGSQPLVYVDTSNPDSGTWTQRGSVTGLAEFGTNGTITSVT